MADDGATIYEDHFVPALFEPWAEQIVGGIDFASGDKVLDVACGTGVGVRTVASHLGAEGAVTGLDFSADMLATAKSKSPEHTWVEASADAIPFDGASFDKVISLFGLMFFPDKPAALREMMRVLKSGGLLTVSVWHDGAHCEMYGTLSQLLRQVGSDEAGKWIVTPFSMGDVDALGTLLNEAGIADATIETQTGVVRFPSIEEMIRIQVTGTPIGQFLDDAQYQALQKAAAKELQRYLDDDGILVCPMEAHVVSMRKA